MRYWIYKCNARDGGPAGYWGDWMTMVFDKSTATQWGGSYSTLSPEVGRYLDDQVAAGDVVVAYQTDITAVVGFCRITKVTGAPGQRKLYMKPVAVLDPVLRIHREKTGTILENSPAIRGPVMLRELVRPEMQEIVRLAGAPRRVMKGEDPPGGFKPPRSL